MFMIVRVETEFVILGGVGRKDGGDGTRDGDMDGSWPAGFSGKMCEAVSGTGWLVAFK